MITAINGVRLAYDDAGLGLPVVYVHGYPHDRTLWAPQIGALTIPTRAVAVDLRGFGESGGTATCIDQYADDIAALIAELGLIRVAIVGVSMGGYVALALWRRAPDLIRAMALVSTRAGADDAAGRARRDRQIEFMHARGTAALADELIMGMVGATTHAQRPELVRSIHAMLARAPVPAIVGALTAMRDRADSTPTLPTISVPALVVAGDEDTLIPPGEAHALHAGIARSRLEIVAGTGHLPNAERPAAFNHILSEFFSTLAYM